jgi:carboxylate-amine ligase
VSGISSSRVRFEDLTLGIEEEYQIVDPNTRDLRSYITQFLEGGRMTLRELMKPELLQSMVELGTPVCRDVDDARREIARMRGAITDLAEHNGLAIVSAATHPFATWMTQDITPHERYTGVVEDMQYLARQLLIFGMHVHVGIPDRELAIDAMNVLRYMMPHVLALSTSSPFWMGQATGLKSFRSTLFEDFPRTGIPDEFESYASYERFVDTLVQTGCVEDATKIWWDIRPHPKYPTLEFRVCDACTKIDEAVCMAAIFQALVAKHIKLARENMTFRPYRRALVEENKWRAVRYGLDGKLIDFGRGEQLSARDLVHELVDYVDDVVDELGSRAAVEYAYVILEKGSSADRQLAVYAESGSLHAVVDHLILETAEGVDRSVSAEDLAWQPLRQDGTPTVLG